MSSGQRAADSEIVEEETESQIFKSKIENKQKEFRGGDLLEENLEQAQTEAVSTMIKFDNN